MPILLSFTKAIAFIYHLKIYAQGQGNGINFFATVSSKPEIKNSACDLGDIVLSEDFDHKNWLFLGDLSFSTEPKFLEEQSGPTETAAFLAHSNKDQYDTSSQLRQLIKYKDLENERRHKMEDRSHLISSSYSQGEIYDSLLSGSKYNVKNQAKSSPLRAINHMFKLFGNDADYFVQAQNANCRHVQDNYDFNNDESFHTSPNSEPHASNQKENLNDDNKTVLPPVQKSDKNISSSKFFPLMKKILSGDPKKEPRERTSKENSDAVFELSSENKILKRTGSMRDEYSASSEKSLEQKASYLAGKSSDRGTKRKMRIEPEEINLRKKQEPSLRWQEAKLRDKDLENKTAPHEQIEYALKKIINEEIQLGLLVLFKEYKTNVKFIEGKHLKDLVEVVIKHVESQIKNCGGDSFYIKNKEVVEFLDFNPLIDFKSLAPNYNPIWFQYEFKNFESDLKLKLESIKLSRIVVELFQKRKELYNHLGIQESSRRTSLELDLITNSYLGKLFLFYSIIINRVFCNDLEESDFIIREVDALNFYSWAFENICENTTDFSLIQIKRLKDKWSGNGLQVSDTDLIRILKKYHELKPMYKNNASKRECLMIWLLVELWMSCLRIDLYNTLRIGQKTSKNFEKFVNFIAYLILNFSPKVFFPKYEV
ncbi:expressed protein [Phakopsora pachyrhizi]|uniref:Expressed protein n=1 Tax=Phakopsora pachyrhizi TaxID=170000 RepID=A0AAV0APY7_PHAPC|nr:expressed protein [Phakopsora pachyrhizi]